VHIPLLFSATTRFSISRCTSARNCTHHAVLRGHSRLFSLMGTEHGRLPAPSVGIVVDEVFVIPALYLPISACIVLLLSCSLSRSLRNDLPVCALSRLSIVFSSRDKVSRSRSGCMITRGTCTAPSIMPSAFSPLGLCYCGSSSCCGAA